jgi:putative DNA primase/helicase
MRASWKQAMPPHDGEAEVRRIVAMAERVRPLLIVRDGDLPATVRELRGFLAADGNLYDRDMPVKLVQPATGGPMIAMRLTVNNVVIEAHRVSQPSKLDKDGKPFPVTLPERVARMYLDMLGEWNLPPLAGVSTAPLLTGDGTIRNSVGYDPATRLWCCEVPPLRIPGHPSRTDAAAALQLLRETFKTFPFADARRRYDPALRVEVTDLARPPGRDESAFLAGLLTAICRASVWLAPGFLAVAPQISGAGTGKGLLVRAICIVAFGTHLRAFTAGHDRQELDKRIVAELIEAAPALFLDNVNAAVLRSETLASVLTERPARVRLLGQTRMVALNSTAFIAVTGNGLRVSRDLARRFLPCELDAHCEDPETRDFSPGFLSAPRRRGSPVEEGSTQIVVGLIW